MLKISTALARASRRLGAQQRSPPRERGRIDNISGPSERPGQEPSIHEAARSRSVYVAQAEPTNLHGWSATGHYQAMNF